MTEAKGAGMQSDQLLALVVARRSETHVAAIEPVADQGMPAVSALHADLMRATCFECNLQQRAIWKLFDHAIVQDGNSSTRIRLIHDHRSRLTFYLFQIVGPCSFAGRDLSWKERPIGLPNE